MATNFKIWVETPDSSSANANVEAIASFDSSSQRINGWLAGNTVSSIKMNSILRQNSLVVAGLMEAFCGSNTTLSLLSTVSEVRAALLNGIATKDSVTTVASNLATTTATISSLQTTTSNLQTSVSNIANGGTAAGNASKLGGQLPAYYQKAITSGTADPVGGSNGDIYIKYS